MHLRAHTNVPGIHRLYEARDALRNGTLYGGTDHDKVIGTAMIPVAESRKPQPQPGNRKMAYDYNRSVRKVTIDEPYVVRDYDYHLGDDGVTRYYNWDLYYTRYISVEHGPFGYNPEGAEEESNAYYRANVKALNGLNRDSTQLGADIGESHQTLRMLSDASTQLTRAILAAKRGAWKQIPGILGMSEGDVLYGRFAANRWLEYQYGWKPLLSSIEDTSNQLISAHRKGRFIRSVGTEPWSRTFEFDYGANHWSVQLAGSWRTVYVAEVVVPGLHQAQSLGVLNPLSVAWELVPFSFVIDWFAPVGQVLEAMTAPLGLLPLGSWTSMHRGYVLDAQRRIDPNPSYGREDRTPGHYQEIGYDFQRIARSSFELPHFFANPSPFVTKKGEFARNRALNALALIRQLTSGDRRDPPSKGLTASQKRALDRHAPPRGPDPVKVRRGNVVGRARRN